MEVSHEATRLQHVWRRACCTAATWITRSNGFTRRGLAVRCNRLWPAGQGVSRLQGAPRLNGGVA